MAQYGEMSPAIVGQLADLSCKTVDSFAAEVALNPGDIVIRGTNAEKQVKLPASGTVKDAIGIVIHEHKEPGTADGYYPIGYAVGVLTRGRIWVPVSKAVTAGKIANSVEAGIIGYNMCKTGNNYQPGDGIVGKDVEETLANVGTLAKKGMEKTNEVIIDIMIKE